MANEVYCRIDPDGTAHIEEMVPISIQELQQLRKDAKLGAKVRGMATWSECELCYQESAGRAWVFNWQPPDEFAFMSKDGATPDEALGVEEVTA